LTATELTFESLDGLVLEGAVDEPPHPKASLVLCHPHPRMGGTMNAPMLLALRDQLVAREWAVLRFNFRGIGRSEGEPSTGEAETEDAAGALDVVRQRRPVLPVAIAGWSFGAAVAVRVAEHDEALRACVAIAPAVREKPGVTHGLPPGARVSLPCPLLVVCGSNDEVVEARDCRTWAAEAGADYVEVNGANHFFWAQYGRLGETVVEWLDACIDDTGA
jgi:uncharacterized protein